MYFESWKLWFVALPCHRYYYHVEFKLKVSDHGVYFVFHILCLLCIHINVRISPSAPSWKSCKISYRTIVFSHSVILVNISRSLFSDFTTILAWSLGEEMWRVLVVSVMWFLSARVSMHCLGAIPRSKANIDSCDKYSPPVPRCSTISAHCYRWNKICSVLEGPNTLGEWLGMGTIGELLC